MGCTQCINKNSKTQTNKLNRELRRKKIRDRLDNLKPCKRIKPAQLQRISKLIEKNLKQQTSHNQEIKKAEEEEIQMIESNFIIDSWKCLIFCSGLDLYQQHLAINPAMKHKCFADIEKDIDRTFPQSEQFQNKNNKKQFKQILQKLSLYFPQLGYTQGINFIVGYLLILGFNKDDTFWMIVHIFLKQEYLFIGFFQNQFPLSEIYCQLFHYLFKRHCRQLSQCFERLHVNDKMWIFKWFMTAYVYSLPVQTIKFIWDYLMIVGGFGLIYFAVSLVRSLESHLNKFEEDLEVVQFFTRLRDLQLFNSLVNLQNVILDSYAIKLTRQQVELIVTTYKQKSKVNNFYTEYFSNYSKFEKRGFILQTWYNIKVKQRYDYIKEHTKHTFIQLQPTLQRFRVKKQKSEQQIIQQLPKITKQDQEQSTKPHKEMRTSIRIQRVQPMESFQHLSPNQNQQIQIGQYVHRISFKKKKNNQNIELKIQPLHLQKQMSEKVLTKKSTPKRIKRKVSKMSAISDKSNQSSSQSQHISVVKADLGLKSSGAIEESMEEIQFDQHNSISSARY